jgi:hypothetical protein
MILQGLWQGLEASAVGDFIASSEWAFPTLESLHVIAIITVLGTIAIVDLRLLGLASKSWLVTAVSKDTLKLTWGAFAIAALTGGLLFVSKATSYMANPYFLVKMCFLILAGVNMGIFHVFTWRSVHHWDVNTPVPPGAKIAGTLSLIFWLIVIFCGRVIGFTLGIYE